MDPVNELIRILDREAVAIEHVLFRLKSMELLLSADEHRFLNDAADELDQAVERLGALEATRALVSEGLAPDAGVESGEITLRDILRLADERQRGDLLHAQLRLRGLLRELEEQTQLDRDLALARIAQVRVALERLSGAPAARYGQDGIVPGPRPPRGFDERF